MNDKVVTKSKLKKFGDDLYNKIKTYVDNKLTLLMILSLIKW